VIYADYIGSYKSNYHAIRITTAPNLHIIKRNNVLALLCLPRIT